VVLLTRCHRKILETRNVFLENRGAVEEEQSGHVGEFIGHPCLDLQKNTR
jgi:hypothetical protein